MSDTGLTLIETLLAVFIMTMAVSAMVGVSIYNFAVNNRALNQAVALNLAREGAEAVRNMRDLNWLPGPGRTGVDFCGDDTKPEYIAPDEYCYDEYRQWASSIPQPCLSGGCQVDMDLPTGGDNGWTDWRFRTDNDYSLYKNTATVSQNTFTYYDRQASGAPQFYRKIKLSFNTASPYTSAHPEVFFQSLSFHQFLLGRGRS